MFFDIILLNTQHGGRFGIAWTAATRGLRFVTKKQVKELNLLKLCEELKLFIISYSASPKKRFSLRLSTILINGVVKIFKEQVSILQGDIFSLISTIHIPSGIGSLSDVGGTGIFETPPTPIVKSKKKGGKKVIKETPDFQSRPDEMILQLPNLADVFQPTARADELSIREEMPKRTEVIEDDFNLGVLSGKEAEEELHLLLPRSQEPFEIQPQYPSSFSKPPQNVIEVVAQIHAPQDTMEHEELLQRKIDERTLTTKSVPKPAGQITERISVMDYASQIQLVPAEPLEVRESVSMEQMVPEKEVPLATGEPPIIEAITSPAVEKPPQPDSQLTESATKFAKSRKGEHIPPIELQSDKCLVKQNYGLLLVKPAKFKFVRINRCNENENQFINETCLLPVPAKISSNLNLFNMFWEEDIMQVRGVSTSLKSLSLGKSVDLQRRTDTTSAQVSTLESVSELQSVQPPQTPDQESAILGSKRETEETIKQILVEEPLPPTSTPRKRKRASDREFSKSKVQVEEVVTNLDQIIPEPLARPKSVEEAITSQELIREIPEQVFVETVSHLSTALEMSSPTNYKLRQQKIINKVSAWSLDQGILTIEEVCEIPINKLNITRAFSDLLVLMANGYVTLESESDSTELKCIQKGPKLITV